MTDEEIHNIYLHMSGKAEGLVEATGTADFPVLFARAILEYKGMTRPTYYIPSKNQREWVGLTDEEVELYWDWEDFQTGAGRTTIFEMVRDIETKIKEKNT